MLCTFAKTLVLLLSTAMLVPVAGAAFPETTIDSGPVTAISATVAVDAGVRLALVRLDDTVRLLRSSDFGRSWQPERQLALGSPVRKLQLLAPEFDSGTFYIFLLTSANGGDIVLWRVGPDTTSALLPVSVGPDTIDDFSAAISPEQRYYLYCVSANEHRTGRTGSLVRSGDHGASWGIGTDFWNCWDPQLLATNGSVLHAVWRYAIGGTQIHHAFNHHYGAPRYWSTTRIIVSGPNPVASPLVVLADTGGDYWSTAWTFYTVARHDTMSREVEYAWSPSNGDWWSTKHPLGNTFVEQWPADAAVDPNGPGGFAGVCYFSGGIRSDDSLDLYWQSANIYDPQRWTRPVKLNHERVTAAVRPKLLYVPGSPWRGPLVLYADIYGVLHGTATWIDEDDSPAPAESAALAGLPSCLRAGSRLTVAIPGPGRYSVTLFDAAGRVGATLHAGELTSGNHDFALPALAAGTYFVRFTGPATATRRITILP